MIRGTHLPDHILRCMRREDRAPLGKAGLTTVEAVAVADHKAELDLQAEIAAYLRLHGIEYIKPDGRKRSPLPVGWPDFTFAYHGIPLALEVKTPLGRVSEEQRKLHPRLAANGWRVAVVRSLPEVQALLREVSGGS